MQIYKDFNYRLREYILKKHGSVSAFCRSSGIKYPAQMTPYLKGQSVPGKKMLEKLEKDGADIDWILHGKKNNTVCGLGTRLMTSGYKVEMEQIMRRMRLLCQQMDDTLGTPFEAYCVLGQDLVLDEFTAAFETFLGYEKGALRGVSFSEMIHPEERPLVEEAFISSRSGSSAASDLVNRFRMADDRYVRVEWCFYANNFGYADAREYVVLLGKKIAQGSDF